MSDTQDRGLGEVSGGQPERYLAAEVIAEAGDYIEDPAVWIALQDMIRRYGPLYAPLAERFGDAAADIMAGTIASYLADQHGVYLTRHPVTLDPELLAAALCHREHVTGYRWCRRHKDEADDLIRLAAAGEHGYLDQPPGAP